MQPVDQYTYYYAQQHPTANAFQIFMAREHYMTHRHAYVQQQITDFTNDYHREKEALEEFQVMHPPTAFNWFVYYYFAIEADHVTALEAKQILLDTFELYYLDNHNALNRMWFAAQWTAAVHTLYGHVPGPSRNIAEDFLEVPFKAVREN